MAITICETHIKGEVPSVGGANPPDIQAFTEPLGYPNPAVICFVPGCSNPAMVGLEQHELDAFKQHKQTEFTSLDGFVKLKI